MSVETAQRESKTDYSLNDVNVEPRREHKFQVHVERSSQIYEQMKSKDTPRLFLGETSFDGQPLKSAVVYAYPDGKTIAMDTVLRPKVGSIQWFGEDRQLMSKLKDGPLGKKFKLKEIKDRICILDDQDRIQFLIHRGDDGNSITISSGSKDTNLNKLTTADAFNKWMTNYANVIQSTVSGIYESKGKFSPESELVLKPADIIISKPAKPKEGLLKLFDPKEQLRGDVVIEEKPNVSFDQIGGQNEAKNELEGISFAIRNPDLYKEWGTSPPKGVMLFGPPGTGKTLLVKALASEANAAFIYAPISKLTSMFYGQGEKRVNAIFDLARESDRAIIFFDEVDAFGKRGLSHEVSERMLNTLLENMDGLEGKKNKGIMVVCATNRPQAVDEAFKRPGRIDRWIEVPLPDQEGLEQIFTVHMLAAEMRAGRMLFKDIDLQRLSIEAERLRMSGADVAEIIRRTMEGKVRAQIETKQKSEPVTMDEILMALSTYERRKREKSKIELSI